LASALWQDPSPLPAARCGAASCNAAHLHFQLRAVNMEPDVCFSGMDHTHCSCSMVVSSNICQACWPGPTWLQLNSIVTRAHALAVMHDALLTSLLCYCCM
jgi:hypothetical protein